MFTVLPFSTILLHGVDNTPRKDAEILTWPTKVGILSLVSDN
jgi:hypothetical protein